MNTSKSPELIAALIECDPSVRAYVSELESEIMRLVKSNANLEVKNLSIWDRAKILEKQLAKHMEPIQLSDDIAKRGAYYIVMNDGGWEKFCELNKTAIESEPDWDEDDNP